MGMKGPPPPDRLAFVRKAIATAIANELDAVEDIVGYVRPGEVVRVMFDIAVGYGRDSSVAVEEIEHLLGTSVQRHTTAYVLMGPIAEA